MAVPVYVLCFLTSAVCAGLLLRAYLRVRVRLLLWVSLCFVGLMLNNLLLIIDLIVFPDTDLTMIRSLPALLGVGTLAIGLAWDTTT